MDPADDFTNSQIFQFANGNQALLKAILIQEADQKAQGMQTDSVSQK
jgi:hypothetical protein